MGRDSLDSRHGGCPALRRRVTVGGRPQAPVADQGDNDHPNHSHDDNYDADDSHHADDADDSHHADDADDTDDSHHSLHAADHHSLHAAGHHTDDHRTRRAPHHPDTDSPAGRAQAQAGVHFDPPRVRLSDRGVAQQGAIVPLRRTSALNDPSSTPHRVKMIVLIAVGLGLLLALAAALRCLQHRRLAGVEPRRVNVASGHLPARREFFRVYGDRMRVAFDERGADVLIVGLGLAAAVALAALIVG